VVKFNGGLFADPTALPLDKTQIDLLIAAARADWRHVEPAIFGTLLERALDPLERHQLGALVAAPGPLTTEQLARGFTRAQTKKVQELLETLVALGQVHRNKDGCYIFGG
jgi:hypothetical protein